MQFYRNEEDDEEKKEEEKDRAERFADEGSAKSSEEILLCRMRRAL